MAQDMGKLVEHGVEINAQVIAKDRGVVVSHQHTTGSRYIIYRFTLGNGQNFSRKVHPDFALWDSLKENDKIPIVYLSENPKINAMKVTVDNIKEIGRASSRTRVCQYV